MQQEKLHEVAAGGGRYGGVVSGLGGASPVKLSGTAAALAGGSAGISGGPGTQNMSKLLSNNGISAIQKNHLHQFKIIQKF